MSRRLAIMRASGSGNIAARVADDKWAGAAGRADAARWCLPLLAAGALALPAPAHTPLPRLFGCLSVLREKVEALSPTDLSSTDTDRTVAPDGYEDSDEWEDEAGFAGLQPQAPPAQAGPSRPADEAQASAAEADHPPT